MSFHRTKTKNTEKPEAQARNNTGYRLWVICLPLGTSVCVVLTGPVTGFNMLGLHMVIPGKPVKMTLRVTIVTIG